MRVFAKNTVGGLRGLTVLIFLAVFLVASAKTVRVSAQTPVTGSASPSPTATPSPSPTPTPVPVGSVVSQAEAAKAKLREISSFLDSVPNNFAIEAGVPQLQDRLQTEGHDVNELLNGRPSLDELNTLEADWQRSSSEVNGWRSALSSQSEELGKRLTEVTALKDLWQRTLAQLTATGDQTAANTAATPGIDQLPDDVRRLLNETLFSINSTQKAVEQKQADLLSLQSKVSDVENSVNAIQSTIKERRSRELSRLFVRDSPSIWALNWGELRASSLGEQVNGSLRTKFRALETYALANPEGFIIHASVIILLALGFAWAARRIVPFIELEPKLERVGKILRHPIAAAFLLSFFFYSTFYPHLPRLLSTLIGITLMIPVVFLLRKIIDRALFVIVYTIVFFYVFDRFRELFVGVDIVARSLFLIELLVAGAFFLWFGWSKRLRAHVEAGSYRTFDIVRKVALVAAGVFFFAFLANILGFGNLSELLGNGLLRVSYFGLALFTLYEVLKGLLVFFLRVRPLSSLRMVKQHRTLIRLQVTRILRWLLILLWILGLLRVMSVMDAVFEFLEKVLSAKFSLGSIEISLGDVLLFVFVIWIASLISRFLRFILQEDVYPRIGLGSGVSYAISTTVHYAILIVGFMTAFGALGFQLTQFAFLVGAIGIGVGFGLQTIFNNFVSGLILLFERPVKVGDMVQIKTHQGTLSHIGLRASILRKVDGSDVIVPNSQLISEEVINWTMSDDRRRLDIPVGVAYGTDPQTVLDILASVANNDEKVLKEPGPRAIFVGFGENSLDFELRAWTENSDNWVPVRSDLVTEIHAALTEAGIEMPFPQRDLNLRNIDDKILKSLRAADRSKKE